MFYAHVLMRSSADIRVETVIMVNVFKQKPINVEDFVDEEMLKSLSLEGNGKKEQSNEEFITLEILEFRVPSWVEMLELFNMEENAVMPE